jgi:hypothetical protein
MTLITGWPLEIQIDDILRAQGMDPGNSKSRKPALTAAAERARMEGISLLHPAAVLREVGIREHRHNRVILENEGELSGPLVARHLAGAYRLIAVICTIGDELETIVSQKLKDEPLYALALDGLGNAAVECLSQAVCQHIGEQILTEPNAASTPLSPGHPEWPVDIGQPEIFNLMDAATAGVTLMPSSMMVPKKSMSFIVGIGPNMEQTGMCEICSLKETCRYTHGQ